MSTTMTAINKGMVAILEGSLKGAPDTDGLYPVEGMSGHFCSLQELPNRENLKRLFELTLQDGRRVYVYHKY
jgi:hypothetical protein